LASRTIDSSELKSIVDFRPDVIICVQEWTLEAGIQIKELTKARIILRRANDEIEFLYALIKNSRNLMKMYYYFEIFRMRMFEKNYGNGAISQLWDIAPSIRNPTTCSNLTVIPPLFEVNRTEIFPLAKREKTVIHVGNLELGHCVSGLRWFFEEVWPKVINEIPDVNFILLGMKIEKRLLGQVEIAKNTKLILGALDVSDYLKRALVYVNPIFAGSGVNMKMIDPLKYGIPVVSTEFGIRGLGFGQKLETISDDSEVFAQYIVRLLSDNRYWLQQLDFMTKLEKDQNSSEILLTIENRLLEIRNQ
jgi:hypothetical protein